MMARHAVVSRAPARHPAAVRPRGLARALAAAAATGIALVWVTVANDLASRGMRINEHITRRQELIMERAAARTALGIASDPRRLAQRAVALGLEAPGEVAIVVATVDPDAAVSARPPAAPDDDSPLALRLDGARRDAPPATWHARLMTIEGWRARSEGSAP